MTLPLGKVICKIERLTDKEFADHIQLGIPVKLLQPNEKSISDKNTVSLLKNHLDEK